MHAASACLGAACVQGPSAGPLAWAPASGLGQGQGVPAGTGWHMYRLQHCSPGAEVLDTDVRGRAGQGSSKPQPHAAAHARRPRCCSCLGDEPTPSPRAPPGWAPPLPSWRGVGSALPARQPLFPSPAVADQAPGVAGAEQLRAREALQPDTLGPIFAITRSHHQVPSPASLAPPCQLVEEGRGRIWRHGWLSWTGCRGRGLCLRSRV